MTKSTRQVNKQKETQLAKAIAEALNYNGCSVWRMNAGMLSASYVIRRGRMSGQRRNYMVRLGPAGMSDIIGMTKKGRFIAIEVKRPGSSYGVTDLQQQFLDNVKAIGGISGEARSVEDALKIIKNK